MPRNPATLVLEDGYSLEGHSDMFDGAAYGEVVFTTNMTGYQEVLTDPSYAGQIVTFTYPLIGNYGILDGEDESFRPHVRGLIVRELTEGVLEGRYPLKDYLRKHTIPVIEGIDTRALTRHIRIKGAMRGGFSTTLSRDKLLDAVIHKPRISDEDLV
ncbi:MAG: carbamoyl-phosphate synthase domain-containing protein, partial [bacterium]